LRADARYAHQQAIAFVMLLVGLTGGIGSGKSEVSKRLAALGAMVVDADKVAREVVEPGTPGLRDVVAAFGPGVLLADGALDREGLGRVVFGDPEKLAQLNAIVHPLVGERIAAIMATVEKDHPEAVVVYDVPLLVENNLQGRYEVVVVVAASPQTQLHRLVEQRGMAAEDAEARIAAQAPLAAKLAVADYVIDNDGDLAALDEQVRQVWRDLVERVGRTMRP
jgi:dephospho-CoA kinase